MKVFVTGGNGFVGRYLIKRLLERGEDVKYLVRKEGYVAGLKDTKFFVGDVNDKESIDKAIDGNEIVYHLVGIGDINSVSEKDYQFFRKVNVEGTKNVLDACLKHNVKKLIYLSSTAAMGPGDNKIQNEESECKPQTPYQRSKYESEQLVKEYVEKYNLHAIILRPSMIYGPGMRSGQLILIYRLLKKGFIPLISGGKAIIPLIYINDLIDAMLLAAKNGKNGEIYIITNDENKKLYEIVDLMKQKTGFNAKTIRIPKVFVKVPTFFIQNMVKFIGINPPMTTKRLDSMTKDRIFDISKAKKDLKWKPKISFEKCLEETLDWFKVA